MASAIANSGQIYSMRAAGHNMQRLAAGVHQGPPSSLLQRIKNTSNQHNKAPQFTLKNQRLATEDSQAKNCQSLVMKSNNSQFQLKRDFQQLEEAKTANPKVALKVQKRTVGNELKVNLENQLILKHKKERLEKQLSNKSIGSQGGNTGQGK